MSLNGAPAGTREDQRLQAPHSAQTYVLAKELRVLGYYSLAAGLGGEGGALGKNRENNFIR